MSKITNDLLTRSGAQDAL